MANPKEILYQALPAIYRIRDVEHGEALRALLGVLDEVRARLQADIEGLYEDWFIETCAEWAIPYIADLLDARMNLPIGETGVYSQRAYVANTIGYRRRKGTPGALEDLGRDVSGWPVAAVEFFHRLSWTQNLNHLRILPAANPPPGPTGRLHPPSATWVGTFHIRDAIACAEVGRPFDVASRTVDVRPLSQTQGWYGIRNVGLFVWRLQSYPLRGIHPRRSGVYADGFHFNAAGLPAPLYTNPRKQADGQRVDKRACPEVLEGVQLLRRPAEYYGTEAEHSFALFAGTERDPARLISHPFCKDLSSWDPPPPGRVAVDPKLGRIAFAPGESPADGLCADYHYAFSGDLGGGPYERRDTLVDALATDFAATVAQDGSADFSTIGAALAAWDQTANARAVITIADSASYREVDLTVSPLERSRLVLQAANGERPFLRLEDGAGGVGVLSVEGGAGTEAVLELDGLLIEGGIEVAAGSLRDLELRHATLIPGRAAGEDGIARHPALPSVTFAADDIEHCISLYRAICGPVRIDENGGRLEAEDSILDSPGDEPAYASGDLRLLRTTVFGAISARQADLVSESILAGGLRAARKQAGCVRYSWVDDLVSRTPRRFRCQPEHALELRRQGPEGLGAEDEARIRARIKPRFVRRRYGQPAYAQLDLTTPEEITRGSEAGTEMGAFEHLKQAHRLDNIVARAREYSPAGTWPGVILVN